MKIGNKHLVYSETFVIPKGQSVSGDISIPLPHLNIPGIDEPGKVGVNNVLHLEIATDYNPPQNEQSRIKWHFEPGPKPSWLVTICGPMPTVPSITTEVSEFAIVAGKSMGFQAVFFGTPHACSIHIQLLIEE